MEQSVVHLNDAVIYTRHTSSCLGVAYVQPAESHSLSMLNDGLNLAPTSNSNYFGYIEEMKSQDH